MQDSATLRPGCDVSHSICRTFLQCPEDYHDLTQDLLLDLEQTPCAGHPDGAITLIGIPPGIGAGVSPARSG
jgi:hypothetical protein